MKKILILTFVAVVISNLSAKYEGQADIALIKNDIISALIDSTGVLRMYNGQHEFASAEFMDANKGECTVENLPDNSPFGPGQMMKITPGDNRIVICEDSSFVLIRRDPRSMKSVQPSNRINALKAKLYIDSSVSNLKAMGPEGLFDPANNRGQHVVTAIADPDNYAGIVAGIVKIEAASPVLFTASNDGRVSLTLANEYGCTIPPDLAPFGGDWWAIGSFKDIRKGLESYADQFASLNEIKLPQIPVGLMTWYCEKYGGCLNETAVVEIAEFIADKFKDYGYDFIQIDDLWQNGLKGNGPAKDFTRVNPNGPYKNGMKAPAEKIKQLGLTPGLWLLPLAINHKDPILADRVPLIAHTPDGKPFETNWSGTALDMTNPKARKYVEGFIRQAVEDWGYDYLKLDGIHMGMASRQTYPARHYVNDKFGDVVFKDKTKSNMQAGRMALKAIRKGAGNDTFILGCATTQNERSLAMCMGLLDAMRVGPDSSRTWKGKYSIVEGVRASNALYFLNGRVWWNDPDSIYAAKRYPLNEVRCFSSWVTITGMLNNMTDWAPDYPEERIDLLRHTMPSHQLTTVRPIDYLENDPARIWRLTYNIGEHKHMIVGFFNWSDEDTNIVVPVQRLGLKSDSKYTGLEFWSKNVFKFSKTLSRHIPARSCEVISIKEEMNHPILLGTSRHITQGAIDLLEEKWQAKDDILSGQSKIVANDPYELSIVVPIGHRSWIVESIKVDGNNVISEFSQNGSLLKVKIISPISQNIKWEIKF